MRAAVNLKLESVTASAFDQPQPAAAAKIGPPPAQFECLSQTGKIGSLPLAHAHPFHTTVDALLSLIIPASSSHREISCVARASAGAAGVGDDVAIGPSKRQVWLVQTQIWELWNLQVSRRLTDKLNDPDALCHSDCERTCDGSWVAGCCKSSD